MLLWHLFPIFPTNSCFLILCLLTPPHSFFPFSAVKLIVVSVSVFLNPNLIAGFNNCFYAICPDLLPVIFLRV